jgi:hypothetical protein
LAEGNVAEKQFLNFLGDSPEDRIRCAFETHKGKVVDIKVVQSRMKTTKKISKKNQIIQWHIDRWADLMQRIAKNPEIADRIPNNANLLFGDDDIIFINGEPHRYSDLVKIRKGKKKTAKGKKQTAGAIK